MVKFHETSYTHSYAFPTVTLAYFLRYPNPYASHVLSTDVISRHFDADTQRLYTARLHLKRSKVPAAILSLLPSSLLGHTTAAGSSQSYILERSIVDVKHGVMMTESKNLEFTGVLSVVERQLYRRPTTDLRAFWLSYNDTMLRNGFNLRQQDYGLSAWRAGAGGSDPDAHTDVSTKVELISRLGQGPSRFFKSRAVVGEDGEEAAPKIGFFRSLGQASIQRSIEAVGLRRTERAVPKSQDGMNVVLERLRRGGLKAVLEGMRRDSEGALVAVE